MPPSMHSTDANRKLLLGQLELARSFLYTAEVADDPEVQYRNIALAGRALDFVERFVLKDGSEDPVVEVFQELRARCLALKRPT